MTQPSKRKNWKFRAVVFGLLPCALGLGGAQTARWSDAVWMTDAGGFWPVTLASISATILLKLVFSDFEDTTIGITAWLTLWITWFYAPMWITATQVPYAAAIVSRDERVHRVSEATRNPEHKVWFLTDRSGARIVHNVAGKVTVSGLELGYRYAEPYIGTRRQGEDLSDPLTSAAAAILREQAQGSRTSRIALIENRAVQDGVLAKICHAAIGERTTCPLKMSLTAQKEETALGSIWSTHYTEDEAIEEKHLPTLVQLLTRADSSLVQRDKVFGVFLDLARSIVPLSQVAQKPYLLDVDQFNEVIRRILISPGSGDAAVEVIIGVNRLSEQQRLALLDKALAEAKISTILDRSVELRITDSEITRLCPRMRPAFSAAPADAVRALTIFGDRLPTQTQRDAVDAIVSAKASYALSAMKRLNFSTELRRDLMNKVLLDSVLDDFSDAQFSKENLLAILTPSEMRQLIAVAVKRGENSDKWLDFALASLPIHNMTLAERRILLDGLLFKSPKAALEFVSKNRDYLAPDEISEITRDYARTVTVDFCLHLSHRNNNWRTKYFSDAQLQIFRDCAKSK